MNIIYARGPCDRTRACQSRQATAIDAFQGQIHGRWAIARLHPQREVVDVFFEEKEQRKSAGEGALRLTYCGPGHGESQDSPAARTGAGSGEGRGSRSWRPRADARRPVPARDRDHRLSTAMMPRESCSILFITATTRTGYLDGVRDLLCRWTGWCVRGIRLIDPKNQVPYESHRGFDTRSGAGECLSLDRDQCICHSVIKAAPESQDMRTFPPAAPSSCNQCRPIGQ